MRAVLCAGLLAMALAGAAAPAAMARQADAVVQFADGDAEMNGAIAQARKTLPVFWAHLKAEPASTHTLKVAIPSAGGGREHIWVGDVAVDGGKITGRLANEPDDLPGLHHGSSVTFTQDQISDWSYEKGDKLYGNYTTRVVLKHIDPAQAAEVRALLSENPVESDKH